MPMNTTCDSRAGDAGTTPPAATPANQTTWSTISAVDRLRVSRLAGGAERAAMPQPAWLVTHTVTRSGTP